MWSLKSIETKEEVEIIYSPRCIHTYGYIYGYKESFIFHETTMSMLKRVSWDLGYFNSNFIFPSIMALGWL